MHKHKVNYGMIYWMSIRLFHSIHTYKKGSTQYHTHMEHIVEPEQFSENFTTTKLMYCQLPVCLCYGATLLHSQACISTDTRNSL